MEYSTKNKGKIVNPEYYYDENGRVVKEVFCYKYSQKETSYIYDDFGNKTTEIITDTNNPYEEIRVNYTNNGQIESVTTLDTELQTRRSVYYDENHKKTKEVTYDDEYHSYVEYIKYHDNGVDICRKSNYNRRNNSEIERIYYDENRNKIYEVVYDNKNKIYKQIEYYPENTKVFGRERTKDVRVYNNEEELIGFSHYDEDGKEVVNITYSPQYNEFLLKKYDFDKQEYKTRVFNNKGEEVRVSKIKTSTMEQTRIPIKESKQMACKDENEKLNNTLSVLQDAGESEELMEISIEESEQTIHKEENKELSDTVSVLQDASKSEELETKKQKCFVIN